MTQYLVTMYRQATWHATVDAPDEDTAVEIATLVRPKDDAAGPYLLSRWDPSIAVHEDNEE